MVGNWRAISGNLASKKLKTINYYDDDDDAILGTFGRQISWTLAGKKLWQAKNLRLLMTIMTKQLNFLFYMS